MQPHVLSPAGNASESQGKQSPDTTRRPQAVKPPELTLPVGTQQPLWKQPGSFWHLNGSLTICANNFTLAYLCKRKPCIQLLVEAIFIIIKNHKQPRYPSTGEQTGISMQRNKRNESWYRPQRGKFPNALMLMKVVRPKRLQTVWFYLYDLLEKIKL